MFFILGFLLIIFGAWFLYFGLKRGSRETRNSAAAMILAGFFLLVWGAILQFTTIL